MILDSGDSGYDEYEDDYAHIITEHSAKEIVEIVTHDFRPVDLPELLVITGRHCKVGRCTSSAWPNF